MWKNSLIGATKRTAFIKQEQSSSSFISWYDVDCMLHNIDHVDKDKFFLLLQ